MPTNQMRVCRMRFLCMLLVAFSFRVHAQTVQPDMDGSQAQAAKELGLPV